MTRAKDISKIVTDADLSGTLDVTGTVTAGGLDIQGDGTISGGSRLTISDIADENNDGIRLDDSTTARFNNLTQDSSGNFKIQHWTGSSWQNNLTVTTGGNVGIGTSSPAEKLDVRGTIQVGVDGTTAGVIRFMDSGSVTEEATISSDANGGLIFGGNSGPGELIFKTSSGTERVRIISGGNVGIGTSSPSAKLHIYKGSSGGSVNASTDDLVIESNTTAGINILTNSAAGGNGVIYFGDENDNNVGYVIYHHADNALLFGANAGERMRVDSSGNLLVGQTSFAYGSVGCSMTSSGQLGGTANGDSSLILNRKTSDGTIAQFRKDNTLSGTIGTSSTGSDFFKVVGSRNYFDTGVGNTGLRFYEALNAIYPLNTDTDNGRDNSIDLGLSNARFDDIFATNGTIQTSDRNEKQDIEELSEAEQRVAIVAKGLMRKFKWIDSVAEKGDNARNHFGIIAQDLQDAFTAEGLDASDYAMFTSNTWWEKEISVDAVEADEENDIEAKDAYTYMDTKDEATEGYTEKTRLGVRYNQLLAFIISAI